MQMLARIFATVWAAASLAAAAQVSYQWTDITPEGGSVETVQTHVLDGRIIASGFFRTGPSNSYYPFLYSNDRGQTWNRPASGLPEFPGNTIFVDVARPGVVYLEGGSSFGSLFLSAPPSVGHLYRSDDFGRSWSQVYTIGIGEALFPFAPDPLDAHGIYAFYQQFYRDFGGIGFPVRTRNPGITRTHNDGSDWSAPLAAPGDRSYEGPTPSAPTRLFIGTFNDGVFVSVDSGATWSRADNASPSPLKWIRPDPQRANVLYGYGFAGEGRNLLLRSDDGGVSWRQIFLSPSEAPALTVDPARPNILWMPYHSELIFRSEDRGDTWQALRIPFRDMPANYFPPATIVVSPAEPGVVYLVWFNRLYRGVPSAPPDPVVVEFNYEGDRYWSTSLDGEAVSQSYRLDHGQVSRTALKWGAWNAADAPAGAVGSCRFWPKPESGLRTRVLVQQGFECEILKRNAAWILEAENEFFTMLANASGGCAAGLVPVHRFHNGQADVNHRWVADDATAAQMRARGWYDEGVRFCARPLAGNE